MKYGYSIKDWNKAKKEIKNILIQRAKVRGMIPYSELVEEVTAIKFEPWSAAFHTMLGEISTEEDTEGRGMLSALVVHKVGDMQPGPGFFDLAEELGRDTSDIVFCWINEVKHVYAHWSKSK